MSEAPDSEGQDLERWTKGIIDPINTFVATLPRRMQRQLVASLARSLARAAVKHAADPMHLARTLYQDIADGLIERGINTEIDFEVTETDATTH